MLALSWARRLCVSGYVWVCGYVAVCMCSLRVLNSLFRYINTNRPQTHTHMPIVFVICGILFWKLLQFWKLTRFSRVSLGDFLPNLTRSLVPSAQNRPDMKQSLHGVSQPWRCAPQCIWSERHNRLTGAPKRSGLHSVAICGNSASGVNPG